MTNPLTAIRSLLAAAGTTREDLSWVGIAAEEYARLERSIMYRLTPEVLGCVRHTAAARSLSRKGGEVAGEWAEALRFAREAAAKAGVSAHDIAAIEER